jgi:mannose-6-phosphate isomerase-like protein (cupin superfamily)
MIPTKQVLDITPIGMILRVVKTGAETNGQALEMEWELLPFQSGTPVHLHPFAEEYYKILEGKMEVNMNGKWQLLQAGDVLTVPKGTPHTFRNPDNSITRVYNIHSPAMRFDAYFKGLHDIVTKLSAGKNEKLKMNLDVAMHMSVLMKKYPEEIISVNPPNFIVSILNGIGKLRGIKV